MPGKYNANRIRSGELLFDSTAEWRQWVTLNLMRKAEDPRLRVIDIQRQVSYRMEVNGHLITTYRADFVVTYADGRVEVQDVKNPYLAQGKGKSTPAGQIFQLKRKLMAAIHGIEIKVI